ncbi:MAG: hypothetical protein E7337_07410 [Clostridiales bacterium]|nr:hypothetical protein [Clostridiales bacterium]
MAYIGIDVGTTGSKATVIEKDGTIAASVYYEYDLRFPAPGYVEMRPDDVWNAASRALKEVIAQYRGPIEAIATASFGEAVVLMGEDGRPVCDSIFYTDVRGSESLDELRSKIDPDALQLRTGMPINSMYTLPKLMWIQKNKPEVLDKTRKVLPYSSYIAYMLSGESAADGSLASRTLMFNGKTLDWDDEILSAFGIDRAWMPKYVPAGEPVGRMLESVAKELGLSNRPMIVSGVHDQIAAALGAGALVSGDVADGIGSAECISAVLPKGMDMKEMFRYNICAEPYAIPGKHLALVFSNTAGAALKWYRDAFEQELRAKCDAAGMNTYAELNKLMPKEPSPVLFLPHLAGTGTPHMDSAAKGMISGLTLSTTKYDIYRAIIEGNNYEMRYNLDILAGCGMKFDALTAVGGGAAPEALQIKADILQKPIHMLNTKQGGTVGMVLLCANAVGEFASFEEGVKALVKRVGTIEPKSVYKEAYDEKFEQYKRMYEAACSIYK